MPSDTRSQDERGALTACVAAVARALAWTWRVTCPPWPVDGPCVAAFLHGEQLPLVLLHRDQGFTGMASRSRDGALLAGVLTRLGFGVVRGSSSRGGADALVAALHVLRGGGRVAIAVDGPRGPAGRAAPGAAALARNASVPLVVVRVGARGWRARSWDRFLVPWPFTRVTVCYRVWDGTTTLDEALRSAAPTSARRAGASDARG